MDSAVKIQSEPDDSMEEPQQVAVVPPIDSPVWKSMSHADFVEFAINFMDESPKHTPASEVKAMP